MILISILETMKELKGKAMAMRGKCTIIWSVFTILQSKLIDVESTTLRARLPNMKDEVAFEREPEAVSKATESFVTTI